jgi:NAD-dependent DNA ligase
MATVTIFDPIARASKTITVTLESAVIEADEDASLDFFIKLTTRATKISGAAIETKVIRRLSDLVRGATQHDGVTGADYTSMTKAIEDYVLNMVEGDGGADAMKFTS